MPAGRAADGATVKALGLCYRKIAREVGAAPTLALSWDGLRRERRLAGGATSLRAIAAGLEERGIPAARGGKWSAVQVARLLEVAAVPFGGSQGASGGAAA
jgi:Recombinase